MLPIVTPFFLYMQNIFTCACPCITHVMRIVCASTKEHVQRGNSTARRDMRRRRIYNIYSQPRTHTHTHSPIHSRCSILTRTRRVYAKNQQPTQHPPHTHTHAQPVHALHRPQQQTAAAQKLGRATVLRTTETAEFTAFICQLARVVRWLRPVVSCKPIA